MQFKFLILLAVAGSAVAQTGHYAGSSAHREASGMGMDRRPPPVMLAAPIAQNKKYGPDYSQGYPEYHPNTIFPSQQQSNGVGFAARNYQPYPWAYNNQFQRGFQ